MRKRNIKKNFWLNKEEATILKNKAKKAGKNEAEFVRCLVTGAVVKEKPDDRFYEVMRELSAIGNNLNQIARKANEKKGFIDAVRYKREAEKWDNFIIKVKREFLGKDYID